MNCIDQWNNKSMFLSLLFSLSKNKKKFEKTTNKKFVSFLQFLTHTVLLSISNRV